MNGQSVKIPRPSNRPKSDNCGVQSKGAGHRERFDISPFVPHPEDIVISSFDKEIVVTVEGAAEVNQEGIQAIRFTGVRIKTKERGFGDLLWQVGR